MNVYTLEYYVENKMPNGSIAGTKFVHVFGSEAEREEWKKDIIAAYRKGQRFDPISEEEAQEYVAWGAITQYHGTAKHIPETDFMREMAERDEEDEERDLFDEDF